MSYGLYIAKVVGAAVDGDDRLQIRILPQMHNTFAIPDSKCPRWPFFFREECFTGTGASDEYVWVVCNDDFSVGYILGMANFNTYSTDNSLFKDKSIPLDLKNAIKESITSLKGESFKFENLKITYWDENSIHFVERNTGGAIMAFRSGALYIARPEEFGIYLGDSKFTVNSNGISFTGPSINLDSENVHLGKNSDAKVLVTTGVSGNDARASEHAWA